jgi:hypothetical protein
MDIELTEQQRQALGEQVNGPVNVVDPQSWRSYVLLRREEYERLQALVDKEPAPAPAVWEVPAGIRASQEAYWRDLPELLKQKLPGRPWVAYHRGERIGFSETDAELYQECERRGIPRGEFYVDRVEPSEFPPWHEEVVEI